LAGYKIDAIRSLRRTRRGVGQPVEEDDEEASQLDVVAAPRIN
jgi:hypothetical protein